jgi:hypothetical protein
MKPKPVLRAVFPSTSCEDHTFNAFMVLLPFWSSGFPLSSTGMNHQNRSLGGRQLDDGIGDILGAPEMITAIFSNISAMLQSLDLNEAVREVIRCHWRNFRKSCDPASATLPTTSHWSMIERLTDESDSHAVVLRCCRVGTHEVINAPLLCGSCRLWLPLRASSLPGAQQCRRRTSPTNGVWER